MIIMGIDPGLATLGYGIIEKDDKGACKMLDCGVVVTPKEEPLPKRLKILEEGVEKILKKYNPDEISMEELFFSKNITTGIAVAHARGVAMLACAKHTEKLFEYTPMQITQALTGYGRAEKKQMQETVASHLKLKSIPKPDDAADALAIALCHGFAGRFGELFVVNNMTRTKGNNAAPATAYQELMAAGERASKRGKSSKGFSSAQSASALQNATGIAGVTGVGRASAVRTVQPSKPKTTGAGMRTTKKEDKK